MKIREASRHDLFAWLRLRQALWPDCPPEQHRFEMARLRRQRATAAVLLAVDGSGAVRGFVEVSLQVAAAGCTTSPVAYLEGWFVEESARGKGLGRTLVEAAEAWARGRGCREIASDAEHTNATALTVHRRLGYEETVVLTHFRKVLESEPC